MLERVGPYRIVRKLGEGGMGVVYAAHDERLNRSVAIKTIREATDSIARDRFVREARTAAAVSHPNVCQLYDIGDEGGEPFLVMELLDGEPLSDRLDRGLVPVSEAVPIALAVLNALEALHARGIIHRDLKPSNVFITAGGVKILDFGLARETRPPIVVTDDAPTVQFVAADHSLTVPGMIVGSPRYMAPEQLLSGQIDQRTDLFACGAILYELLSGKSVFTGETPLQIFHAIVYEQTPNLGGSATIVAVDRIIHRAMAKQPEDRYQSAQAMASDLREVMMMSVSGPGAVVRQMTRLIVLPFRILRSDPETDFLAWAVPDAVTSSLAALESLVVRSPMTASRATSEIDLTELARTADVDAALTGTMLRAGNQIRITAQLVETPSGTVLWSLTSQTTIGDFFELQDGLTQRIVEALEIPLSDREQRLLRRDVPASPRAHELYLRATRQGESPVDWATARDLYVSAVEEDPRYAPAWARLARIYLLLGKFVGEMEENFRLAEEAIGRALQLNPDLPLAHQISAQIEVALGRAKEAMLRLLGRLEHGANDPSLLTGLVMCTRFCGLLEASAAAHEQAIQLDPHVRTSAGHTYWMLGEYEKALATIDRSREFSNDESNVLESMGRLDDALASLDDREKMLISRGVPDNFLGLVLLRFNRAIFTGQTPDFAALEKFDTIRDAEGMYHAARNFARGGRPEQALAFLELMEERGFYCYPAVARDPWLDSLRGDPRFKAIMKRVEGRHLEARVAFEQHPGSRVLAVGTRR